MTSGKMTRYVIAAALACAAAGMSAAPAMAQVYWGPGPYYYGGYYGGAPGARWNPTPPAGRPSNSRAARHDNCPTGTYGCY